VDTFAAQSLNRETVSADAYGPGLSLDDASFDAMSPT
jgi:hypothetical protein